MATGRNAEQEIRCHLPYDMSPLDRQEVPQSATCALNGSKANINKAKSRHKHHTSEPTAEQADLRAVPSIWRPAAASGAA